jgi:hypothetical protein
MEALWRCCEGSVPGGSSPGKAHLNPDRAGEGAGYAECSYHC